MAVLDTVKVYLSVTQTKVCLFTVGLESETTSFLSNVNDFFFLDGVHVPAKSHRKTQQHGDHRVHTVKHSDGCFPSECQLQILTCFLTGLP